MFVLLVRIQREMAAPTAKSIDAVIDRKKASSYLLFLVIAHTIKCILHDGSNRSKVAFFNLSKHIAFVIF